MSVWDELKDLLTERRLTGRIVLHCDRGRVQKLEVTEVRRPAANGEVELSEVSDPLTVNPVRP